MYKNESTRAEVDLKAIVHNVGEVRKKVGSGVKILGVVKADGYGHGSVPVAETLIKSGVEHLGVARLKEALTLREAGLRDVPILIFGSALPEEAEDVVKHNLTPTVCTEKFALSLSDMGRSKGKTVKVHVNVDTGMGRWGVYFKEAAGFVQKITRMDNLEVEGIYTHFPSADEEDKTFSLNQIEQFKEVINCLEGKGIKIPLQHTANSAAILKLPESYFNMVRPGLLIYGLYPYSRMREEMELIPVLSLKTRITYLKEFPAGQPISYDRTYITDKETLLATIPIGYGDGYSRFFSNKGEVLIRGRRAPVRGRVCMDQTIVEVGHISGVAVGDEAVLIGSQGKENITVEEMAEKISSVPHEFVCRLGKRIPRVFSALD